MTITAAIPVQTALFQNNDDPILEAAKTLIRPYVKRGSGLDFLKDMGAVSPNSYWVTIGGYMNGKKITNEQIGVSRDMNGKEVNKIFKLKEIYKQIEQEG